MDREGLEAEGDLIPFGEGVVVRESFPKEVVCELKIKG